jgi:hypothetical protein
MCVFVRRFRRVTYDGRIAHREQNYPGTTSDYRP